MVLNPTSFVTLLLLILLSLMHGGLSRLYKAKGARRLTRLVVTSPIAAVAIPTLVFASHHLVRPHAYPASSVLNWCLIGALCLFGMFLGDLGTHVLLDDIFAHDARIAIETTVYASKLHNPRSDDDKMHGHLPPHSDE
jgi:hypothetical protein